MVDKAKASLDELVSHLAPYAEKDIPIIGLEPSCLFTLKDEALVMGFGERAVTVSKHVQLLEEFLASEAKSGKLQLQLKPASRPVLFHGHCHQKSFAAVTPAMELLKLIPNAETNSLSLLVAAWLVALVMRQSTLKCQSKWQRPAFCLQYAKHQIVG
jgi:Fe-S oxidoreductase